MVENLNHLCNFTEQATLWELTNSLKSKKTLDLEVLEIKRTLFDFIELFSGEGRGLESGWIRKNRRTIQAYNIYGRII